MQLELTKENMKLFFPTWLKPLSDKEINDFINGEPLTNPDYKKKEYARTWRIWFDNKNKNKKYETKKAIRQAIQNVNIEIETWMEKKRNSKNEMHLSWCDIHIEDLLIEKKKFLKKLDWIDYAKTFKNNDKELAKQIPIENFLEFNRAGFAKCPFHSSGKERTASFHKIQGKNKAYCFGGCGTKDVIDIVMQLREVDFNSAIKIILGK